MMQDPEYSFEELIESDLLPFDGGWPTRVTGKRGSRNPYDEQLERYDSVSLAINPNNRDTVIEAFRREAKIRFLSVTSVDQNLFEAICLLKTLQRLDIERTRLVDLSSAALLANLTHLCITGYPKLKSFEPLEKLRNLRSIGLLGVNASVDSLEPLANMPKLISLSLLGQDYKNQQFKSSKPLGELTELKYLSLVHVTFGDGGISAFKHLHNLEYLDLTVRDLKRWPISDYVAIYENCPNLKGDLIRLAATDKEFQRKHKIS